MYRSRGLFIGAAMLWVMVTLGFFVLDSTVSSRPPIAEGALASLLTVYLPVLVAERFFAPFPHAKAFAHRMGAVTSMSISSNARARNSGWSAPIF